MYNRRNAKLSGKNDWVLRKGSWHRPADCLEICMMLISENDFYTKWLFIGKELLIGFPKSPIFSIHPFSSATLSQEPLLCQKLILLSNSSQIDWTLIKCLALRFISNLFWLSRLKNDPHFILRFKEGLNASPLLEANQLYALSFRA